jgi:integrase
MPLRKIKGIWYVDITFDGRRIRQTTETADKAQAQRIHDELKQSLWARKHLQLVPWKTAVVAYMEAKAGQASYEQNLSRLREVDPWLGHLDIQDIRKGVIEDIKAGLLKTKKPATVNRSLTLIRAILNHAVDREWLDHAPRVKLLPAPPGRLEYLTPEEVEALLPHLKRHQREFLMFALATGMRMRNITHLEWVNVSLFRRQAIIHADESKGGRPITIPLDDDAMEVLKARHRECSEGRVFRYHGKEYDRVGIRALNAAAKKAGIGKHIHPHLLRHTFASWHIMSGTSLAELRELGGWAKLESVMVYAHLSVTHLQTAVKNRSKIKSVFASALVSP